MSENSRFTPTDSALADGGQTRFVRGVDKNDIADVLNEIAVLLELQGENPFKTRAYQTGARALETLAEPLETLITEKRLRSVKGIGEAIAEKVEVLHTTGKLPLHERLKSEVAPGLLEMLQIPGVGPKKVRALHEKLGISDLAALTAACKEGRVATLEGFGEKTQQKILEGIANREAYGKRHLWWDAFAVAEPILAGLRALPQVVRAEHAGSLRRGLETVGDLDFIVAANDGAPVMDWFCKQPEVKEVTGHGATKSSVRFASGLQADLRIVPPAQFVFALHHFTGSKDHNVQMRQRALARGLSLGEWGLTPVEGSNLATPKIPDDETALFGLLGLKYITPELREGLGEIEAAEKGELPALVEATDIRGAFHNHTVASDGRNTLAEMAAAADALGWEYLGIADHSKSSFQANGLDEARLARQLAEIQALNASKKFKVRLFTGSECDILPDGRLDFDAAMLSQLDCVVVSVHSVFALTEEEMTARIIRAIETPHVTMLGHLTGRLLLRRESYKVNAAKIIDAAIANRVIIELNSDPHRLDMDWRLWRRAAEKGVLTSLNPDAHRTESLRYVEAGVRAARKGWLTRANVFNTRPLAEVETWLLGKR